MEEVEEIKKLLGIKSDGMAYLVMTGILPEERVEAMFRRATEKAADHSGGRPKDHIPGLLSQIGIDLSAVENGMDDTEKDFFCGLLSLWMGSVDNPASASVFILMLRRYLIPMAEKKRSLEKAIALLGKEAEA